MPVYEQKEDGSLAVMSGGEELDEAIRGIERADDNAIVQRMTTGLGSKAFLYDFPIRTSEGMKHVIGISSAGADEMAKQLGNMEALNDVRLDKDSDPDYIYAMVRVKDLIRNVTLIGVGRQCKFVVGKGNAPDHDRMDEHAFVKAITKGQRNGILHHVSEDIVIKIIDTYLKQGKSERIIPPTVGTEVAKVNPVARPAQPPVQPPKQPVTPVVKPPVAPPATAPAANPTASTPQAAAIPADINAAMAKAVAEQQERLKNLRVDVNNRFMRDLSFTRERRQQVCKESGLPESLTDMNEEQLKKAMSIADDMVNASINKMNSKTAAAPAPAAVEPTDVVNPVVVPVATQPFAVLGFESAEEQTRTRGRLYTLLTDPEQLGLTGDEAKKFIGDRGYTSSSAIPKDKLTEMVEEVNTLIETKKTSNSF